MRIALTGGIATGKSYCLQKFAQLGVPVIDADVVAHDVVDRGSDGLAAVVNRFGPSVLRRDGTLDRSALAALIFADPNVRRDLERIVHPLVYQHIDAWFASQHASGLAIADIPLLFETGHDADFDRVIVTACTRAQQLDRLRTRSFSTTEADQRLAAQMPIEEKRKKTDYVIDTSGTTAETDRQVIEVWERLKSESAVREPRA